MIDLLDITCKYKYCLDNVDFKKIHKAMDALNWRWADVDRTPTIEEMKSNCDVLMISCLSQLNVNRDNTQLFASTGGFVVRLFKDTTNNCWEVEISFEVSSWCSI